MNKSQQFILSEHLEELKDAAKFVSFLVIKREDTLLDDEIAELFTIAVILDDVIYRIEEIIQK